MRYSQLFGKTNKTPPGDEDSINARYLIQAGYISKQLAGVYNYLPLGLRVLKKIQDIIRDEMNALGGNEILMPTLTQEENYKTTGRDNMDILFKTTGPNDAVYFLNPTHEEIVTPLVKKYVFSYQDLPQAVYQIQNKFRNEPRAKNGILRGREFNMKDFYSFHADEADLNEYYEKVKAGYFKVFDRLGLGEKTVLTFASGGVFSKYSHEFQTLCESGEDTIYLCPNCRVAVNKEIINEQNVCPECGNKKLQEEKGIEVGNIFKLRTRFSEPFGFVFMDKEGKEHLVEMGCYGIGPSRVIGTLVEVFHDDKGIIWPESVAPYQYHLAALGGDETVRKTADDLYATLQNKGVEVLYDDREGPTAGEKFADADLIGLPHRLVISKKTLAEEAVEYKKRGEEKARLIKISDFLSSLDRT